MRTGAFRYCYEKKKNYSLGFIGTDLMVLVFQRIGKNFLDGSGHWMSKEKRIIRVNQLSQQKYVRIHGCTRAQLPDFTSTAFTAQYVKTLNSDS